MKNTAFLLALLLICMIVYCPAQSGRRVRATPTPVATPQVETPADYSESAPNDGPRYSRSTKTKKSQPEPESTPVQPNADTTASGGDDEVVKVSTDLVTVSVSVYERSGIYVSDLSKSDFKIFEDGKEQPVAYFGTQDQPFSVVLLIDTSPSTSLKIEDIQNAAMAFVNQLSPQDKVMVISFDYGVHVHTDFTNDRQQINRAIHKTNFGDGTSLYNAVDVALRKKLSEIKGRKAIVLFTDGVDTTSHGASYEGTLAAAEEGDSVIFPVYYNTYLDQQGIGGGGVMGTHASIGGINGGILGSGRGGGGIYGGGGGQSAEEYARGRAYLQELARVTGGAMYRPESTPGGLSAAFEGIAQELRAQYSIGYYPQNPGKVGQRKTIKVRVSRPDVAVRARDSYVVGASGPVADKGSK